MNETPEADVPPTEPTAEAAKPAPRRRSRAAAPAEAAPAETAVVEATTAEAAAIETAATAPAVAAPDAAATAEPAAAEPVEIAAALPPVEAAPVAPTAAPEQAPAPASASTQAAEAAPPIAAAQAVSAEIRKVVTADPMAPALKAGQKSLKTQSNALAAYVTMTTQWTQHWQSLFGASLKLQQQIARQVMASASSLGDFTAAFGKKESKDKR